MLSPLRFTSRNSALVSPPGRPWPGLSTPRSAPISARPSVGGPSPLFLSLQLTPALGWPDSPEQAAGLNQNTRPD